MDDNETTLYEDFFGTKEGKCHAFSFFYRPIQNTEPLRCITIPDIYRYIVGPFAKAQTETLRSIAGKDAARKYKAENFDFCTFSGIFRTRSKDGLLQHSELLCIDFDHVADIPSLKERLLHDEYFETELIFRSPSGDGLKWIIAVDRRGWEHSRFYKAVYNYLVQSGYPEPDKSGSDVSRSCFIPYDAEAYINPKYNNVKDENFFTGEIRECPF